MENTAQTAQPGAATWFSKWRLISLFIVPLLLIVMVLLYKSYEQRLNDYVSFQQSLMEKSAADTVQTLVIYIQQTRRVVNLLAAAESELIYSLFYS